MLALCGFPQKQTLTPGTSIRSNHQELDETPGGEWARQAGEEAGIHVTGRFPLSEGSWRLQETGEEGSANFCEGPDSGYFCLCRPYGPRCNCSISQS